MDFTRPYTTDLNLSEAELITYFLKTKAREIESDYQSNNSHYWRETGEKTALSVFRIAAQKVPAYKHFLKKNKIDPEKIKTINDFKNLPTINKHNYLRAYPLKDLCLDGDLSKARIISCSSGSTGEPFFWPRGTRQEVEGAQQVELLYRILGIDKPTLIIIGFAFGNWISGSFMYLSSELVSKKGYPITVLTTGFSKKDIFRSVKFRAGDFEQLILMGYPPFIKDIIDEGEAEGINWKKLNVKFVFAAEGFSPHWRKYLYDRVGARDYLTSSVNIYGTADAGILAHETPFTLAVRKECTSDEKLHQALFGDNRMPTLAQYDPRLRYFEVSENRDLLFTANAGLPLIRYSIGDYGGLANVEDLEATCKKFGHSALALLKKEKVSNLAWNLPCVYVFGRKDFTATLYGANIYPESIREALLDRAIADKVSGKFTMFTKNDKYLDQFLSINVELKVGINPNKHLISQIQKIVIEYLRRMNNEYSKIYDEMNHRAFPEIVLYRNSEGEYFQPGTKHRWTRKKA